MTPHQTISLKISELHQSILTDHPTMPTLLREIHQNLKLDPENVTLLTPEQVAVIVSGLSKQTDTTITASILKGTKGKSAKNLSVDDV
jgi:DNA polymerase III psi subunit